MTNEKKSGNAYENKEEEKEHQRYTMKMERKR